jgi:phosphotransferase system enzyme I (PtsI)
MVCGVEEVRAARALLDQCASELMAEGLKIPEDIQIGAMIEIPSAAMSADLIAAEVDFLSLGTNDLIQYTLAVDRLNERVADLYQPTHIAVLRLIQMTVEAGKKAGIRVCICGEMAADIELTPLLVGLGLSELSVASSQVARIKHAVRKLNAAECSRLAVEIMQMSSAPEILAKSRSMAEAIYPELFA